MEYTLQHLDSMTKLLQSDKIEGDFRKKLEEEYIKTFEIISKERQLAIKQLDKLNIANSQISL